MTLPREDMSLRCFPTLPASRRSWLHGCGAALALAVALLGGCGTMPPPEPPSDGGQLPAGFHTDVFSNGVIPGGFKSPSDCLICHENIVDGLAPGGHWQWQGVSTNIVGHETEIHGKRDLINAFQLGVPSNESYCSICHLSYGWADKSFNFATPAAVDCLVCHDTTGTYGRLATPNGGAPGILRDGALVPAGPEDILALADQAGAPTRRNCGSCHFYADGGDNVMHGDMSSSLLEPTKDVDVHMGSVASGGQDYFCQSCHSMANHRFSGWTLHSVDEGGPPLACTRCHTPDAASGSPHQRNPGLDSLLNLHISKLACEMCHIPAFARYEPTIVGQDWSTAGQNIDPVPTDAFGQPTYDKNRGTLTWGMNVAPVARWSDGRMQRKLVFADDTYTNAGTSADPVVLAGPVATKDTPGAKVTPFKVVLGRQPADPINHRLVVPHLSGTAAGPNAFWGAYDWNAALQEGAAYDGFVYSGQYTFVNTISYLPVNHQIPPKEQAHLCESCHWTTWFWADLGLVDPLAPQP
jgi:octaheme c-type cytochrome (tetrathionate reductase family)